MIPTPVYELIAADDEEFEELYDVVRENPHRRKRAQPHLEGPYKALRVKVILLRDPDYDPRKTVPIGTSADVARFVQAMEFEVVETMQVLLLNARHHVIGIYEAARGTMTSVEVHPSEILRPCLATGAVACIMVHNHPSGDAEPSEMDVAITRRVAAAAQILGIKLLDHIVIGADHWVSLAERGEL